MTRQTDKVLAGPLSERYGADVCLLGAGLIIVVSTLLTLLVKEVRQLERQPKPVPVGAADWMGIVMGQSPVIALLPSALLGPAVWQPVQAHLHDAGHNAIVVGTQGRSGTSVHDILTWYLDSLPTGRDYVLVPHSNAGLYIPAITQQRSVTGLVFVDAILPPREGTLTVAPEGLQKMLRHLAGPGGELPVWTSWWPADDVAALFPSDDVRTEVSAEQRRFPLSYFAFDERHPPCWARHPGQRAPLWRVR